MSGSNGHGEPGGAVDGYTGTAPGGSSTLVAPGHGAGDDDRLDLDVLQVGPYRVLRRLGEGSMGVVYLAEQRDPIRRVVALKLVKSGMDSEEVLARFKVERQALALMDHPNVAKVHDAGVTEQGRPYFAMEYVPGVPVTQFGRDHQPGVRQRLELFVLICRAVQHAHQKGIIHRDLKPTNILVTVVDGRPVPKVIDFGIAKALNPNLTRHTLYTEPGRLMGTPAYMSPEQADSAGVDVDTRTDVYSLGVILYELLAGALPFDPECLRGVHQETVARIIRESDPPKPSTRLRATTLGLPGAAGTTTRRGGTRLHRLRVAWAVSFGRVLSAGRGGSSPKLSPGPALADPAPTVLELRAWEIRGDLDWITLKALEKDRARRYESPGALAEDIERHLSHRPVVARPPSRVYRVGRFARRHRLAVTTAAAVALALLAGIVGTSVGLAKARAAQWFAEGEQRKAEQMRVAAGIDRDNAEALLKQVRAAYLEIEASRKRAEAEARKSAASNQFMLDLFAAASPDRPGGGRQVRVADLLDRAAADLRHKLKDQPEAVMSAYLTLAKSFEALGLYKEAEANLRLARETIAAGTPEGQQGNGTAATTEEALEVDARLAWVLMKLRREGAEDLARSTFAACRRSLGDGHRVTLYAANVLGCVLLGSDRHAEGEAVFRAVLPAAREHAAATNGTALASYLHNLALSAKAQGKLAEAEDLQREAMRHPAFGTTLGRQGEVLAEILAARGKLDEAKDLYARTLAGQRERLGDGHPDVRRQMGGYAALLLRAGEMDAAVELHRARVAAARSRQTEEGPADLAHPLADMGEALSSAGRADEAAAAFAESIALTEGVLAEQAARQSVWRFAALRAGLGRAADWASPALRAQAWCVLDDALAARPTTGFVAGEIDWPALRFKLYNWSDPAKAPAEGGLAELKALPEPTPGFYLLALRVPRAGGAPPVAETVWVTFAPWDVALYRTDDGPPHRSEGAWQERVAAAPDERRRFAALALVDEGVQAGRNGFGPGRVGEHFGLVATAGLPLPAGPYRLSVTADDGARAWVGGRALLEESWTTRGVTTDVAAFDVASADGSPHPIRVEYFQAGLGARLWVRVVPTGPAADAMAESALRDLVGAAEAPASLWRLALADAEALERGRQWAAADAAFRAALARGPAPGAADEVQRTRATQGLARVLGQRGDHAGAVALYREVVTVRERVLGFDHADTLSAARGLARELAAVGDGGSLVEAVGLRRRVLESARRAHSSHPAARPVLEATSELALALAKAGLAGEAADLRARLLDLAQAAADSRGPGAVEATNAVAQLLEKHGDWPVVERAFRIAFDAVAATRGPDSFEGTHRLHGLGWALRQQGPARLAEAESVYCRAWAVRAAARGERDPEVTWTMADLAAVLADLGRPAEAAELGRRLVAIRREAWGDGADDTNAALLQLGGLLAKAGDRAGAEGAYRQAVENWTRFRGPDHAKTRSARDALESFLKSGSQ